MTNNRYVELSRGMPVLKFGKYKSEYLYDVAVTDPEYVTWMINNLSLPDDVITVLESAL